VLYGVVEDGVTGILCEPGNIDQFAMAIGRLVKNSHLRDEMGMKENVRVQNMFTMDLWLKI